MLWTVAIDKINYSLYSSHKDSELSSRWMLYQLTLVVLDKGPLKVVFVVDVFWLSEKLQNACVFFSGIKEKNFFLHYEVWTDVIFSS